jgi:hypothetical protein
MFSGFNEMNRKHLRIGYGEVKALLETPEDSVILGRKTEEAKFPAFRLNSLILFCSGERHRRLFQGRPTNNK